MEYDIEQCSDAEIVQVWRNAKSVVTEASARVKAAEAELMKRSGIDKNVLGKTSVLLSGMSITWDVPINTKWDQSGLSALWDKPTITGANFGSLMKMELAFPAASMKLLTPEEQCQVLACRIDKPGSPKMIIGE